MYEKLGNPTLKSGEQVELGVVKAPAGEWLDTVEKMLGHKGPIWDWQNSVTLRQELGIEVYYYILHRDGKAFSNIMTAEVDGVGLFGHVWTDPDDRRKGAASFIMEKQMQHFRDRGGRTLTLGTGFDSAPYHIYKKYGFEGCEDQNGYMWYFTDGREKFQNEYFAKSDTTIEPIDWKHWPSAPSLVMADVPGAIRCCPIRLFGRVSSEGPMIHLLVDRYKDPNRSTIRGQVLVSKTTGAVVGIAAYDYDKLWQDRITMDVFCHPNFWDKAGELLAALNPPQAERYMGYSDAHGPAKSKVFEAAGYKRVATLPNWVRGTYAKEEWTDTFVYEKR